MDKTLVTSYHTPDIDGVACSVAYAEFLNKTGTEATAGVFGQPDEEAQLLLEREGLDIGEGPKVLKECENVVFVDACKFEWTSNEIKPEDVVEVIDHRKDHFANEYPNAESQIEIVGAAATLIAERFYKNDIEISTESGTLLYAAILDNTANFNANVTTDRDIEMAEWLEEEVSPDQNLIENVFREKSSLKDDVKEIILDDYYTVNYNGNDIGVSQLEILNLDDFITKNTEEIEEKLQEVNLEQQLDYVFLTSADIKEGFNVIIAANEETEKLLSDALSLEFKDKTARTGNPMLRKEIMPQIKQELTG